MLSRFQWPSRKKARILPIVVALGLIAMGALALYLPNHANVHAATAHPGLVGAEAPSTPEFVDAMKTARLWEKTNGGGAGVALDSQGWPQADARTVVFDERPCCPFFSPPSYDDPNNLHSDVSGTYHLSFTGQATIAPDTSDAGNVGAFVVQNQQYNSGTNTTTADIVQAPGHQLMIIQFTSTKRNPGDSAGTGVTNVKLIRPGYAVNTTQIFTNRYINSLRAFSTLRFMGMTDTNHNPGYYGDTGHHVLNWSGRNIPADATQESWYDQTEYPQFQDTHYGIAWEYIIAIGNAANKDIWINIPVAASSDYVQKLAQLIRYGGDANGNPYTSAQSNPVWAPLNSNLNVYIEHGNELWNYGTFLTAVWNELAATFEVCGVVDFNSCPNPIPTSSNLNSDGTNNQSVWAERRHARELKLAGDTFRSVFSGSTGRIRPVLAWWELQSGQYSDMLNWINSTYGTPSNFFYAMATGAYDSFDNGTAQNGSVSDLLNDWITNSNTDVTSYFQSLHTVASNFGLKLFAYEGAIENRDDNSDSINISNRVLATRDPGVQNVVTHHLENWFNAGGDLFMYFTAKGANQRYGYYGATEDYNDLYTYLEQGIYAESGQSEPSYGGGLTGTFYNSTNLSGAIAAIRIDNTINFDLTNAPSGSIFAYRVNAQNFSVLWNGYVVAPASGSYTFSVKSAGGVKLTINGATAIDDQTIHSLTTDNSGAISLSAGNAYSISLQYAQTTGTPVVQLLWTPPGQSQQVIPGSQLYSATYAPGNSVPTPTPTQGGSTPTPTTGATPSPTPSGNWTFCANENQTCSFTGTQQVRYGANGTYFYQTATNSIACNNATFGDPTPGVVKHCDVSPLSSSTPTPTPSPTPSGSWTFCANENQTCTFTGTQQVRYGANGTYNYQTATNSIACNNATFGDPLVGVAKHCDVSPLSSGTPTPTPSPTPSPTPTGTPTSGVTVPNGGFETPSVGSGSYGAFQYTPSGASWTFAPQSGGDGAGISGNGSGFTSANPSAPEGSQVAFIQAHGSFSQAITFGAAGSYKVSFQAAQRGQVNTGNEDIQVLVDGNVVGTITASGTTYSSYSTTSFTVSAGSHTVQFKGVDSAGGDNTVFIDAVTIG